MKNQWRLIAVIVLLLLIITFAVLNVESVPINFGLGEVVAPLIIIIFISLLLGSLLTLLVSTTTTTRNRKELKTLHQQATQQEEKQQDAVKRVRNEYEARIRTLEEKLAEKEQLMEQMAREVNPSVSVNQDTTEMKY